MATAAHDITITATYFYEDDSMHRQAVVTVDRTEAVQAAVEALGATRRDGRWAYRDDATHELVVVSEDDIAELGAALLDGKDLGAVYSLWCSSTECEWIDDREAAPDLTEGDRVEAGETDEDYDVGTVVGVDGPSVTVAWDQSLVTTTQHHSALRRVG